MEILSYLAAPLLNPLCLGMIALGVFLGIYIGAIPGLSATMAISLLVSFTYGWSTHAALAVMIGVYVGARLSSGVGVTSSGTSMGIS